MTMTQKIAGGLTALFLASGLALAGVAHGIVNINTADQSVLAGMPGVGKHKAQAIVQYRHDHGSFKDVHDLTHVKGITEKVFKNILKHNPGQLTISG